MARNSLTISGAVFKPPRYCVAMLSNSSDRSVFILQLYFLLILKKTKSLLYGGIFLNCNLEGKESVWGTSASDCRGLVFHQALTKVTVIPRRALFLVIVLIITEKKLKYGIINKSHSFESLPYQRRFKKYLVELCFIFHCCCQQGNPC